MTNQPLVIYRAAAKRHAPSTPVASLSLTSAQVQYKDGVQLRFDVSLHGSGDFECLSLDASMSDQFTVRRYYGRVDVPPHERPLSASQHSLAWLWRLLPEEIEALESNRSAAEASVGLSLQVTGIGLVDGTPVALVGESQIELSAEEWQRIKVQLGYGVPPSYERLLTPANLRSPSWRYASDRLAKARERLAAGDAYDAMQDALNAFEALEPAPYDSRSWAAGLGDLPAQKAEGIARLLAGYCSYLNRVGHHRDRVTRTSEGEFPAMPIDPWEAEMAIAVGQFLLAYAHRIRPPSEALPK